MIKEYEIGKNITLVVKQMPYLNSVSYCVCIPGGYIQDKEETLGASLFLPEITSRGTKKYDARKLSDVLDSLGLSHSEATLLDYYSYKGTSLSSNIKQVLDIIFDMIYEPSFPKEEVANVREILLQELLANEDNPTKLAIKKLVKEYHVSPFNRNSEGTKEGINNTKIEDIISLYEQFYKGKIQIVLAGNVPSDIDSFIKEKLGDKNHDIVVSDLVYNQEYKKQYFHVDYDSEQTQVALSSPAPSLLSDDYYTGKVVSELLSGGMFGRLFIEVREKRGLVYTVYNQYVANKYYGKNILYAGTTPKNAKETLNVALDTIATIGENLEDEELNRAKNNLKSSIFINSETSLSQATNIAFDIWQIGKPRTNEYIASMIEKVTKEDIKNYIEKYPYKDYTLVSLGKKRIEGVE